jgi:hypothetical protein
MAAYKAWECGLQTAGIMDHDTIAGAEEFIEASKITGIAHTIGFECRCRMDGTPFAGKRLNNPDQRSLAYLTMQGVPHQHIPTVQAFLTGYRRKREIRNRAMVDRINAIIAPCGVTLDYSRDVAAISESADGGSVTERHILYALAQRLIAQYGEGEKLIVPFQDALGICISAEQAKRFRREDSPWFAYTMLGLLKAGLVEQFYINAEDECPDVDSFLDLAKQIGAIPTYSYLGDVRNSVTGDKKDQEFEDAFLDELIPWLSQAGFRAVAFMPSRNTPSQLIRIMGLCRRYGLFQISGEDINSPFQSFICPQLSDPAYNHLVQATWALIGHEAIATKAQEEGMFTQKTLRCMPSLEERIAYFAKVGHEAFAKEGKA